MRTEFEKKSDELELKVGDYFIYEDREAIFRITQDVESYKVLIMGVSSGYLYETHDSLEYFKEYQKNIKVEIFKVIPKYYDTDRQVMVFTEV
jgi:hypothetical protein